MKTHASLPPSVSTSLIGTCAALALAAAAPATAAGAPKVYRFTSTATNTADNVMTVDHPVFNTKPTHRLIVTQYSTGVANPHPVGVRYNHITRKWQIFNEDQEDIPVNANFNVMIAPTAKPVSVGPTNLDGNLAFFPLQKGNADARLLFTHMSNPIAIFSGVAQTKNIGLFFIPAGSRATTSSGRWALFPEDGNAHFAAVYNVADVTNLKVANTLVSFRHTAVIANTTDGETVITNPLTDAKPNAVLFVHHVFTANAPEEVDETLGVRFAAGKWRIFTQDGDDLPPGSTYVVAAFPAVTP